MKSHDTMYGKLPKIKGTRTLTASAALCGMYISRLRPFPHVVKNTYVIRLWYPRCFTLGDVVFQSLMKMSKDCHSPAEYNRYHAELSCFLEDHDMVRALGREAAAAIFQLKCTLRAKEHKLAGYVRHTMKNHMHAMTTSPTKGQNVHLRHGPDQMGQKYQTHKAL